MMEMIESLFSAGFVRAFALTLFHSLWQGALFALLTGAIVLILRKYRPSIRYAIFYFLLVMIPVVFIITFFLIFNTLKGEEMALTGTMGSPQEIIQDQPTDANINELGIAKLWYSMVTEFFEENANLFVMVWLLGFIFFLARFTSSLFFVNRLKKNYVLHVEDSWSMHLRRLSDRLGLKKTVRLAESGLAKVPLTIGYLKPVILLPVGTLSGVPPQQIDAILLHELAHILRKDYLLNIFQCIIELLFFYHPVTWWLSGLIREEREHICDDLAVDINQDQLNYIKALTTMEELNSKSPVLASAMTGSRKKLLNRVRRIVAPAKVRKGHGEGVIGFVLLIGLVLALSLNALSFIPSSYDLTGRESGEPVYNLLPFLPAGPDTIKATSSSGKVKITVFTDTVSEEQQKALQEMAEAIDNKEGKAVMQKRVIVRVDSPDEKGKACNEEHKVIVISDSDSSIIISDSIVIISPSGDINREEFNKQFQWYSVEMDEALEAQQEAMIWQQLSEEEFQDQMKDIQIDIEKDFPDGEFKEYEFYLSEPSDPPVPPQVFFEAPVHKDAPAEKIVRQELRDDGLTVRGKKYIIEINANSMYINGEKQPKDVYRKYGKIVESMEGVDFKSGETFKMIF